jgi:hypothetical protein
MTVITFNRHLQRSLCRATRQLAYYLLLYVWRDSPPPSGPGLHHSQGSYITHNDASQSVGLLWTNYQLVAETSTLIDSVCRCDKMYEGCPESIRPFEYLENRSCGLDVTLLPVRGDLTAHPCTVTLPWVWSIGSETPLTELVYCVTVTFTMTERADQLLHNNAPAHSTALVHAFCLGKQVCQPPYSPDLAPCEFWLFPKLKSPLKGRRSVNAADDSYYCRARSQSYGT